MMVQCHHSDIIGLHGIGDRIHFAVLNLQLQWLVVQRPVRHIFNAFFGQDQCAADGVFLTQGLELWLQCDRIGNGCKLVQGSDAEGWPGHVRDL